LIDDLRRENLCLRHMRKNGEGVGGEAQGIIMINIGYIRCLICYDHNLNITIIEFI